MDLTACMVLVALSQLSVTHSAHVSGAITESVTFFYRKLPVAPSVRATIEFSVSHQIGTINYKYPSMGIYTKYPTVNIEKRCSDVTYGQLRNENLHPHLRVGRYRTTACELSEADTVNCRGKVTVQDYIPSHFYSTFRFLCNKIILLSSLQGLTYNISFTKQSNNTSGCIKYSEKFYTKVCSRLYHQTSLPNLIGDESLDQILEYFDLYKAYKTTSIFEGRCYQHLEKIACYTIFPKCDPITRQMTYPCRETCWDVKEACLQKLFYMAEKLVSKYDWDGAFLGKRNSSMEMDCDYLLSVNSSVPCFYKPVTCDSPPDVPNGMQILNITQKSAYELHDVVQYACVNEAFEMIGKSNTTCLYSGEWSRPSPRCIHHVINSLHPLLVVLPILVIYFTVYMGLAFCTCCSQTKHQNLRRTREYDAFVCYCYEGQYPDFAEKIVPQELEEKRDFKLCIHRQDFKAGWDIKWNIMNAIWNSNSAIIIMS